MRFVDGHERDVHVAEEATEPLEDEALRRHVDQRVLAPGHPRHAAPHLLAVEGGGEERRAHVACGEGLDLVVHQGDERRDDEGGAAQRHRRKLVGEALPPAGGGDQQELSAGHQRLDGLALAGTERCVSEAPEPGLEIDRVCGQRLAGHPAAL